MLNSNADVIFFNIRGFVFVGQFPSGEKHLTSMQFNGFFIINLPNPVEGGSYTCRLSSQLPPASCLPQNASVLRSSSVSVDEVRMRLSLVEAEQDILQNEKRVEIDRLTEENRRVKELAESLQNQLDNKTYLIQNLQDYFKGIVKLLLAKKSFKKRLG